VLKRIFELKREKIPRSYRKLHTGEKIVCQTLKQEWLEVIKSCKGICPGHEAHMGEMKNVYVT
jgi:hypothetical protein